jgi:hypothetical protein
VIPEDNLQLAASEILGIPASEPDRLFSMDAKCARSQLRSLNRYWHPDRNSQSLAGWVFSHIQDLYQAALAKRRTGIWDTCDDLTIRTRNARCFRFRYCNRYDLDSGQLFVGKRTMAQVFRPALSDLAAVACNVAGNLDFADQHMRLAVGNYLPRGMRTLSTAESVVLVSEKSEEFVPLHHLLAHAGGTLPARHVAWIVSSLLNIGCYLQATGIAHQAISIEHLLVSPENHAIALSAGWEFATPLGTPVHALPCRSMRLAPPDVLSRKLGDSRLDQFLVRATALDLLGSNLDDTPSAMQSFLLLAPAATFIQDYERWQQTLWDSFGERRFIPLDITPDDIYGMTS